METLLTTCVLPARPHALPFRVIFQELLQRRRDDLLALVASVPDALDHQAREAALHAIATKTTETEAGGKALAPAREALDRMLRAQEDAYAVLAREDLKLQSGTRATPLDPEADVCATRDAPLIQLLHGMELSALCLSGGGIRSASFSLGVMEELAKFSRSPEAPDGGLMDKLDYLSTVSGGGYIGSWMMSWAYRRFCGSGKQSWQTAYREVISALAGSQHRGEGVPTPPAVTDGDPEPQTIRHLRSYTSYLAPQMGASLDTFTLFAIVLRNLFVNWLMLLPLLFALVSGGRFVGLLLAWLHTYPGAWVHRGWGFLCVGNAVSVVLPLSLVVAAWTAARALPSHRSEEPSGTEAPKHPMRSPYLFLASVLLGSTLLTIGAHVDLTQVSATRATGWLLWLVPDALRTSLGQHPQLQALLPDFLIGCLGFGIVAVSIYRADAQRMQALSASLFTAKTEQGQDMRASARPVTKNQDRRTTTAAAAVGATLAAAAAATALLVLLNTAYVRLLHSPAPRFFQHAGSVAPAPGALFIVLVLPSIVSILLLTTSLFCALLGVFEMEEDREWWVRSGGALLAFCMCWVGGQALIFYGAPVQYEIWAGITGLVLGLLSSLGGYSGATSATARTIKASDVSGALGFLQKHQLLLVLGALLAVLLMAVGVTAAEEWLRGLWQPHFAAHQNGASALAMCAVCTGLAGLLNWAININLFSLQGMYRMRLMRAYLGASNVLRRPDPFTGFDPKDTPQEFEMPCNPGVPMHLVNCTLNLTGTSNTAWRQRKAESFTFSPIVCGGWRIGYVATEQYGSQRYGMSLASAMSISGAAFNPNMGYHTSPLLSLLMTFFNVRLGAWLPNPKWPSIQAMNPDEAKEFVGRPGPTVALKPLIDEALGRANDTKAWVELSDGGHFENLGLYEMVMRRVKTIVVVDAGADADYQFEDLGNAVRKIRIDLGILIEFHHDWTMERGFKLSNSYCGVGTIRYSCLDKDATDGILVYIKPVLTGTEPLDVYQYARTHATFPHETTANQFFNEPQFESYRKLGSYAVNGIHTAVNRDTYDLPNPEQWKPLGSIASFAQYARAAQDTKNGKRVPPVKNSKDAAEAPSATTATAATGSSVTAPSDSIKP